MSFLLRRGTRPPVELVKVIVGDAVNEPLECVDRCVRRTDGVVASSAMEMTKCSSEAVIVVGGSISNLPTSRRRSMCGFALA